MAETSDIEWTEATWNIITGCSVVSPGCTNCYAMRLAGTRMRNHPSRVGLTKDSKAGPVWTGEVRLNEEWLDQPLRWKRPRMIFVCAHSDLFHENVPDEWIDQVFAVMALAQHHTFQVLTKRAERMRAYMTAPRNPDGKPWDRWTEIAMGIGYSLPSYRGSGGAMARPLPNLWLGVSAEDQRRADERIPHLLATPAAVRWVSAEPLLGPLDLTRIDVDGYGELLPLTGWQPGLGATDSEGQPTAGHPGIDWIVAGGESGPGARPMNPAWVRQLHDQCKGAEVPFFFKQWGAWISSSEAGYSTWDRTGRRDGQVLGRVSGFDPRRGTPGLDGRDWPSAYPFPSPPDPGPVMINVGKANAGRLLNGVQHNGMPAAWKERP